MLDAHRAGLRRLETDGPLDMADPSHQALMLLGAQSQCEVLRSRHRVVAAMRSQACEQGRYLGGRPPYGYRLVEAGPHPNLEEARRGRRLLRLDPDPLTAPHVRWIFARRLSGAAVACIARELNERGIPCPSHADRERNPHRSGQYWTLNTVAAILANPRYTGRQVWNRHPTTGALPGGWVISDKPAHPPLVSETDFLAAQNIRAARSTRDGTVRAYLLTGLLLCGLCHRRMDSHWANDRPGYRRGHGHTSIRPRPPEAPRPLYLREDHLLDRLTRRFPAAPPDPAALAAHLRAHALMIVCTKTTCALATLNDKEPAPGAISQTELFTLPMG